MALSVANKASVRGTGVSSVTTAAFSATTGNLLYCSVALGNTRTFTSLTDVSSNTFTTGNAELNINNLRVRQSYVPGSTFVGNGSYTTTLTMSGVGILALGIIEIAGALATSPADASGQTSDTLQTSHAVSTSGATTQNDEICVAMVTAANTAATFTADGAYIEQNNIPDAAALIGLEDETRIIATTGTQTCTPTTNVNVSAVMMIITFKQAAAAIFAPYFYQQVAGTTGGG